MVRNWLGRPASSHRSDIGYTGRLLLCGWGERGTNSRRCVAGRCWQWRILAMVRWAPAGVDVANGDLLALQLTRSLQHVIDVGSVRRLLAEHRGNKKLERVGKDRMGGIFKASIEDRHLTHVLKRGRIVAKLVEQHPESPDVGLFV